MKPWKQLDHTADIGLRIWGSDLRSLFLNAAAGLVSLMVNPSTVRPERSQPVSLEDTAPEDLLVRWLQQPIVLLEGDGFVCASAEIDEISQTRLIGSWLGEPLDRTRHELRHGVKAVTWHALEIRRAGCGLTVDIIFDV